MITRSSSQNCLFQSPRSRAARIGCAALLACALAACSSNDDSDATDMGGENVGDATDMGADMTEGESPQCVAEFGDTSGGPAAANTFVEGGNEILALVAQRALDFSSGQIERLSVTQGNIVTGAYPATGSDISVDTDGESVYQIGRFQLDSITRFSPQDTSTAIYQRSVAGDEAGANPYQIVFASASKAYVIRYGSSKIWIVDPSATDDASFRVGEIDLSAYDVDGIPEASAAVIIGDSLFVLMERLENFSPVKSGYIAVFDTTTDAERETCQGQADGLKGIQLGVQNPTALQYSQADGSLYVVGRGNFFAPDASGGDRYTGGVESVDVQTYAVEAIADDGTEESNSGFFNKLMVVSATEAYVVTLAGFGDTTLRRLNLVTGALGDAVAELSNIDITTLAMGPAGNVWVGIGDAIAPGFRLLQPADSSVRGELVATTLIPINVVFMQP